MEKATEFCIVFVTIDNYESGLNIARALIADKFAACCSIIPGCTSVYEWQGEVEEQQEFLIMIKTSASNLSALEEKVKELHTYEVPEIISVPLGSASAPYLNWMNQVMQGRL